MSAVTPQDALAVTTACLELLRVLPGGERRRVLSALTVVVDLTEEPRFVVGVDPASGPDRAALSVLRRPEPASDTGMHSAHFACAPEDVPEPSERVKRWGEPADAAKEKPERRAPKDVSAICLEFAKRECGTGATQISLETGLGRMTAQKKLLSLLEDGLVHKTGTGRMARYHVTSRGRSQASSTSR